MSVEVLGFAAGGQYYVVPRQPDDEYHEYISIKTIEKMYKCKWKFFSGSRASLFRSMLNACGYMGSDFSNIEPIYVIFSRSGAEYLVAPTPQARQQCERFINSSGVNAVEELVHELRYHVDVVGDVEKAKNEFESRAK